jgi:hypothetical protein
VCSEAVVFVGVAYRVMMSSNGGEAEL